MVRLVGTWYGNTSVYDYPQPEYRFAKITKRTGKEYLDRTGSPCVDVEVDLYGYRMVDSKCKPYAYDDSYYLPTVKVNHKKGYYRLYHGKGELWLGSFTVLKPWDGKTPLVVRTSYGID